MLPDTWLPTVTVVTASSVPVAAMVLSTSPRVTASAVTTGAGSAPRRRNAPTAVVVPMTAVATNTLSDRDFMPLSSVM